MSEKVPGNPAARPAVAPAGGQEHARLAAGLFDELIAQPLPTQPAALTGAAMPGVGASADWLNDAAAPERASARADTAALIARIGKSVGPYRLAALLGRGGMGAVYAAKRDDGSDSKCSRFCACGLLHATE